MKFIVIGLGNFGLSLSQRLTALGHEVIGVDGKLERVEAYKDGITQTICLDATNEQALMTLPFRETDFTIVAIGEDFSASVMVTAMLRKAGVKKLVSRAINDLHYTVIETIGVDLIIQPEADNALQFADRLVLSGVLNSYEVSEDYRIIEVMVPERYAGNTLGDINFEKVHQLQVITVIRDTLIQSTFGPPKRVRKSIGFIDAGTKVDKGDRLLLFGTTSAIESLFSEND